MNVPAGQPAARGGSLAARCVVLSPGRYLTPGEVRWDSAGRITSLRRPRGAVHDLCIVPGLIDAHTHLQIEPIEAPRAFVPWVRAVMAARAATTAAGLAGAARGGALARLEEGVTAVGEIDSTGLSPQALAGLPLAGRCYQEVVGYDLGARAATQRVAERNRRGDASLAAGLSPHAPYSVGGALFRAAARARRHLAIHCAETPEEQQFLHTGRGPFADLLRDLGKLPAGHRPPRIGAVRWLTRLGLLRATTQLVHCQELEPGDAERIAAARAPIVVCPGTIAWFGRTPPPVPQWLALGIPVALGTDSRASNSAWSLRAGLAAAARMWPELSPMQLLGMATAMGGRSLGRPRLGRIRVGGRADLLALPWEERTPDDTIAAFVLGATSPEQVVAAGHCVAGDPLQR